jgi:3-hydroxyisobutyrate dehydrogenase
VVLGRGAQVLDAPAGGGPAAARHGTLQLLAGGDFMRTFGLDRCYEELQIVTELARGHHLPVQVSEAVADVYQRALRRYGPADGELLAVMLLEEQSSLAVAADPQVAYWQAR